MLIVPCLLYNFLIRYCFYVRLLFLERLHLVKAKIVSVSPLKGNFYGISNTHFHSFCVFCFDFCTEACQPKYSKDCRLQVFLFQGTQSRPFLFQCRNSVQFNPKRKSCCSTERYPTLKYLQATNFYVDNGISWLRKTTGAIRRAPVF